MNEELILLEKLQEICDDMDNMICTTQKPFIRLKLMEVISDLDQKISTFEEWADEQGQIEEEKGIWSEFAEEGLMSMKNTKPQKSKSAKRYVLTSRARNKQLGLIKKSSNAEEARLKLEKKYKLSETQAKAIIEMRLRQLTGLEQSKLREEYDDLQKTIKSYKELLDSKPMRMNLIKDELSDIKEKYGDERRSVIEYAGGDFRVEDIIPNEKVVITISHAGYIKRTALTEYKTQNRGGVGQKASKTRDEDFLEDLFVGTNHQYMLFFTQKGKCFWIRV